MTRYLIAHTTIISHNKRCCSCWLNLFVDEIIWFYKIECIKWNKKKKDLYFFNAKFTVETL